MKPIRHDAVFFGPALVAALVIFNPCIAHATAITLYNTGVDASANPLPDGTVGDSHYTLSSVPSGSTTNIRARTSAGGFPVSPSGPWHADDSLSTWIGPNNDGLDSGPTGIYDYQTTFTLSSAGTVDITGQWAAATSGTEILLNGINEDAVAANYTSFTPFTINDTGLAGTNTIDFLVSNSGGPTGLRVEFNSAIALGGSQNLLVPEPSSLAILGIGAFGLLRRRRKV